MDVVLEWANRICDSFFRDGGGVGCEFILEKVKEEMGSIDSKSDRIKFLNVFIERNNLDYLSHQKVCKNPGECEASFEYESLTYKLLQEQTRNGVKIDQDIFDIEEKDKALEILERITQDLNELKLGHQIIYDDLMNEINELRSLFFLGKKNWYQLLIGKSVDMVASGIISDTVSKQIIDTIKQLHLPALKQS